jgi:competence protein ComEA
MIKPIHLFFAFLAMLILALSGCGAARSIEIHPPPATTPVMASSVYIGGDVEIPGTFRLKPGDTLEDLLQAAGGMSGSGDCQSCYAYFFREQPDTGQKVDINRAPAWLLQALPGVGEVTAGNIIEYRRLQGPFRHIKEIIYVDGIGEATFAQLEDKICVAAYPERPE